MAQICGFFDANLIGDEFDRVYVAEQFAQYFASFISNGIFNHAPVLSVTQETPSAMGVTVTPGQGWINGYWYKNDEDLILPIDAADGVLNRIDIVVLRWDRVARNMYLQVLKGTPATNPVAPRIVRDSEYFDLCLAQVRIPRGALTITNQNISDTRMNNEVCGWVHSVITQVDTTTLYKQFEDFYNNFVSVVAENFALWSQEQQQEFTNFFNTSKQNFEDWFATIQAILDEQVAARLLEMILQLQSGKQDLITGAASSIVSDNLDSNMALISNNDGKVIVSQVSATELGYLENVTSPIQSQINNTKNSIKIFENISVPVSAFISDSTYPDYPFKANISLSGITSEYVPTVNFAMNEAISGDFSPIATIENGILTIYAEVKPIYTINIPNIVCIKEVV